MQRGLRGLPGALLVAAMPALACDSRTAFDALMPKDDAALGRKVLDHVQRRELDVVESMLDPSAMGQAPRPSLERVAAEFPTEAPKSVKVIGFNSQSFNDQKRVSLTYEYEFSRKWLLAYVTLLENPSATKVQGLLVRTTSDS